MFRKLVQVFLFFLLLNSFETEAQIPRILNIKDFGIENTRDATPNIVETLTKCKEEGISKLEFPESPNLKIINCDRVIIGNNIYRSLSCKKGTLSIDDKTTNINIKKNETFLSVN